MSSRTHRFSLIAAAGLVAVAATLTACGDKGSSGTAAPATASGGSAGCAPEKSDTLVLLTDDKHLQPAQNLVPIASKDLADAGGAELADTLNAITAKLTTEALTQLGVSIVVNHEEIADVARQFLQDNSLI